MTLFIWHCLAALAITGLAYLAGYFCAVRWWRVPSSPLTRRLSATQRLPLALPGYYGVWVALCALVGLLLGVLLDFLLGQGAAPLPRPVADAALWEQVTPALPWCAAALAALVGYVRIKPGFAARHAVEAVAKYLLIGCASLSILITLAIVFSVIVESVRFFKVVSPWAFLTGTEWSPQIALRADQAGSSGAFGALPLFVGTLLITAVAMAVALPIGLFSAIYMAEYASPRLRDWAKPMLEILAGVPTVVYGYFAIIVVGPALRTLADTLGLSIASESALAAGLVMGIMIIPFISSLSDDIITAVPRALREASFGLGATQAETIRQVVLPAALPGIMGAALLGISRAVGETMIVVMAAGLAANMTFNPLEAVTTVTAQIVTLLVGDQEFDSPKTLAAFALGLTLFVVTLCLNIIALVIVRKYREKYE